MEAEIIPIENNALIVRPVSRELAATLGADGLKAEQRTAYEALKASGALTRLADLIRINGKGDSEAVWEIVSEGCRVVARLNKATGALVITSNGIVVLRDDTPDVVFICRPDAKWPRLLKEAHEAAQLQREKETAHQQALQNRQVDLKAVEDYFANI